MLNFCPTGQLMTTQDQTEKNNLDVNSQKTIKPTDIARKVSVWEWILDPKGTTLPNDLSKDELVEVYYLYRESLSSFTEALERVNQKQNQVKMM